MAEKSTYEELENLVSQMLAERSRYKKLEAELKRNLRFTESLLTAIPTAIFFKDAQGRYQGCNPAFTKIMGFAPREVRGKTVQELWPNEHAEVYHQKDLELLQNPKHQIYEFEVKDKNGTIRPVIFYKNVFRDEYGNVAGLVGGFVDITDIKRTENALQEAYRIINRSPAVAFLWKNQEGWPVEFVSDNVVELFGYTVEEFTSGQVSYANTIHRDDLKRVAKEVATFSNEKDRTVFVHEPYRIISKDGHVRWLDDRTYIRRDNDGNITHYEGIVVNITDRIQAAEALRENIEKLARLKKMESLGLLAGGVAHDLNNVLSGIVSYPDLLLHDLQEDSPFRKSLETIKESGDRAVAIVQDLLTVARGVATTKEPLNLNDLIDDYLRSPEFKKLKQFHPTVMVKTNFEKDLLNIIGSQVHIRKVVMNLLSNASEAIRGNGNVTLSTMNRYVDRPLRRYNDIKIGEYAVLTVSDNGSGISSGDLERIFEPFYTKKVMGRSGTGLGLAVVWNVVQDHKGYIDLTSNDDGTTFELFFPITRQKISRKDLSIPFKELKGNGEKILVIDDVESQRDISCQMLEALCYKTKAVSSGEEAVEYLKKNIVDLILLDMIMDPGINGLETYEKTIKIHPKQKAIIVSGFAETADVKKAQKLGAGKFIRKPLTLEKIGIAIKEELGKIAFSDHYDRVLNNYPKRNM